MDRFQEYELPRFPFYMRENSISWFGIDEADKDYWDKYFKLHPLKLTMTPWGKKKRAKAKPKAKAKKAKAKASFVREDLRSKMIKFAEWVPRIE